MTRNRRVEFTGFWAGTHGLMKCVLAAAFVTACEASLNTPFDHERVLSNAWSHNDYHRDEPLSNALAHGLGYIEVDLWYDPTTDPRVLVGHDEAEALLYRRTLAEMYLEPLAQRVATHGTVWPWAEPGTRGAPPLNLVLDIKSDGTLTYHAVLDLIDAQFPTLVERWDGAGNTAQPGAVRLLISGDRDKEAILGSIPLRYAGIDGRLDDLEIDDATTEGTVMPMISDNFGRTFPDAWDTRVFSLKDASKLQRYVGAVRDRGQRLRFWGLPDDELYWSQLAAIGGDRDTLVYATDDPERLVNFLRGDVRVP